MQLPAMVVAQRPGEPLPNSERSEITTISGSTIVTLPEGALARFLE